VLDKRGVEGEKVKSNQHKLVFCLPIVTRIPMLAQFEHTALPYTVIKNWVNYFIPTMSDASSSLAQAISAMWREHNLLFVTVQVITCTVTHLTLC